MLCQFLLMQVPIQHALGGPSSQVFPPPPPLPTAGGVAEWKERDGLMSESRSELGTERRGVSPGSSNLTWMRLRWLVQCLPPAYSEALPFRK